MTGRAKNPDHLWPLAILRRTPGAESRRFRFMSNVQHPSLSARLTCLRCSRIRPAKADEIAIRQSLGLCSRPVNRFLLRPTIMKRASRSCRARTSAAIRAEPFIALIGGNLESHSADTTFVLANGADLRISLSPTTLAGARTVSTMNVRARQLDTAFDAVRLQQHVISVLQRERSICSAMASQLDCCWADCSGSCR